MNRAATTAPGLRPYRIKCAGLEYIALAASSATAVADAIALHGLRAVSVSPLAQRQGGAA